MPTIPICSLEMSTRIDSPMSRLSNCTTRYPAPIRPWTSSGGHQTTDAPPPITSSTGAPSGRPSSSYHTRTPLVSTYPAAITPFLSVRSGYDGPPLPDSSVVSVVLWRLDGNDASNRGTTQCIDLLQVTTAKPERGAGPILRKAL